MATNICVFQTKGPSPMKQRWSMRRRIVTSSNLGFFWHQALYYDYVDCNWVCELNLQWLFPWSHFWLQVSWWHSSMLSMPANLCWKDNYCYFIVALVFFCLRALIKTELNWTIWGMASFVNWLDTSADGLPDGALFANWAASVKLKLLEEESPGQVFWASPLDSHCIFLPLSLLDPTSNFWISWLQVNTYPAQRLMACFWVLARRYRTQMVSGDQH